MEKYIRKCPKCNRDIECKTKEYLNVCEKKKRLCKSCSQRDRIQRLGNNSGFLKWSQKGCNTGVNNPFYGKTHTESTKEKIRNRDKSFFKTVAYKKKVSDNTRGVKNPMYGKSFYDIWVNKYGKEQADVLLLQFKENKSIQSSGENNPMYGKPSPQGSGNGWSGWYNGVFFRSLKELSYVVGLDRQGVKWKSAESIKIRYISWDGVERTYCPDFLVEGKSIVEVKPTRLRSSKTVQLKEQAAKLYCASNGLSYEIIDPVVLSDDEIKSLRKSGVVKFTDRYERLFLEKYK